CEPLIQNPDGKPIPIDPLIQDVGLQQKGVLVYEEAKVQYHAILRAFADKTGIWPDPAVTGSTAPAAPKDAQGVASAVQALLAGVAPSVVTAAVPLLTQLIGKIPVAAASPGSDIPAQPSR